MLSNTCKQRNETLIPSLLGQHDAVLTGDITTIDLSTAENWLVKGTLLEGLSETMQTLSEEALSYTPGIGGSPETRQLVADLLNRHFNPARTVDASHIVLAAGGSFALTALVQQICDPGDGVLIAAPYWAGLDISISVHYNATIAPVHIPLNEFFSPRSVQHYEAALQSSAIPIKAVLVCNPHNPLGQCYPRETLQAMLEFCRRRKLHYISDEVYALSGHCPVPEGRTLFVSVLELSARDASCDWIHVIYSLSKDFGCSGIRVGMLITQENDAVRLSAALSVHSQVSSVSTLLAARTILNPQMVRRIQAQAGHKLREAYGAISSFLRERDVDFIPVAYGMFVFARFKVASAAQAEEQRLLYHFKAVGVSVSTGSSYHFQQAGWFRICYALPLDRLREALRRIEMGVENYDAERRAKPISSY